MKIVSRRKSLLSIPMASMADVAFLLLVFLILTSALNLNEESEVVIPFSEQARPVENERAFEIIVTEAGIVFYQDKSLSEWELQNRILQEFSRFPNTIFFIKGDEDTVYEKIDSVLSILKKNHIQNVVMMAHQSKEK
jgi:biopolymer transport protein ExbD